MITKADIKRTLEEMSWKLKNPPNPKKVYKHLMNTWPGAMANYNAWYVIHHAEMLGLLDEDYHPIEGAQRVYEGARRMGELVKAGGFEAVVEYVKLHHGR